MGRLKSVQVAEKAGEQGWMCPVGAESRLSRNERIGQGVLVRWAGVTKYPGLGA